MTILVVGSTGTLGFLAAEAAHAAGQQVVAMVRDRQLPAACRRFWRIAAEESGQ